VRRPLERLLLAWQRPLVTPKQGTSRQTGQAHKRPTEPTPIADGVIVAPHGARQAALADRHVRHQRPTAPGFLQFGHGHPNRTPRTASESVTTQPLASRRLRRLFQHRSSSQAAASLGVTNDRQPFPGVRSFLRHYQETKATKALKERAVLELEERRRPAKVSLGFRYRSIIGSQTSARRFGLRCVAPGDHCLVSFSCEASLAGKVALVLLRDPTRRCVHPVLRISNRSGGRRLASDNRTVSNPGDFAGRRRSSSSNTARSFNALVAFVSW